MTPSRYPAPPAWAHALATVAVTGTNGKSSAVHWVAAALRSVDPKVVRVSTLGSAIGDEQLAVPADHDALVALLARARAAGARHAALEVTSAALALGFAKAWPCRVALFTNLSEDHLDLHRSAEHYLASKAQLFVHLPADGVAVLPARDPASALLAEVLPPGVRLWRYGVAEGADGLAADLVARDVVVSWQGSRARLELGPALAAAWQARAPGEPLPDALAVPAPGQHFLENALGALLAATEAGVAPAAAVRVLCATPAPAGRFERVWREPCVVVDYAHTPDALGRTLATARLLCRARVIAVVGAGGDRDKDKRAPMGREAARADVVIVTSDNPRGEEPGAIAAAVRAGLEGHPHVETELDRRAAIARALALARPDDLVLVCGKGHERSETRAGVERPFDDAAVVRAVAAALRS
ncbi:MAG: UDP-N-acetylmuramyl-tripeptide synthetase [Polyangiaceae bacterium]|nr:UDP-N-acetylmuramyl-tripeptide synthetase [Polyangiaceae bacterium]